MSEWIRTRVVKIGNSHGVRIPSVILKPAGLSGDVEMSVEGGQVVIRSVRAVREGWAEAFRAMAENRDDELLEGDYVGPTEDWEWK